MLLSLVAVVTLGLPVPQTAAALASRQQLVEALERTGARGGEGFNALKLPVGYNCRGFLWLGPARAEAVWDSGASRNSIDKDYLRALLNNDRTSSVVTDVTDIEPLNCQGLSRETRIQVSQVAYLNTTFMEDSRGQGGT